MTYPKSIHIGGYNTGHIQGIAIDKNSEYIYCSFTTCLVKADMTGKVVASVKGLAPPQTTFQALLRSSLPARARTRTRERFI